MTKVRLPRFSVRTLRRRKVPSPTHFLSRPVTFWIAVISLFAFVSGNMLGQHGWTVFWSSVLGQAGDEMITYDGTTSPIPLIPDPIKWAKYGGSQNVNTYQQAPKDILIPYPTYKPFSQLSDPVSLREYAVDFGGDYITGAGNGDHPGVDMDAPEGTPVVAAMNGIVTRVDYDSNGYGNYVILRHPNVPDPRDPSRAVTLYSLYGHMSSTMVTTGMIVRKGEQIGNVGKTGDATGFHLHFQLQYVADTSCWAFTYADLKKAGISFAKAMNTGFQRDKIFQCATNSMAYVQNHYPSVMVASNNASHTAAPSVPQTPAELAAARKAARLALLPPMPVPAPVLVASNDTPSAPVAIAPAVSAPEAAQPIASYRIETPFQIIGRKWTTVRISLLNDQGEVISDPIWKDNINLRTGYGQAQFRPEVLKRIDFKNGVATFQMLSLGQTVVISLMPQNVTSDPVRYVAGN